MIVSARTSNMLNRIGENRHSYLVPSFKENGFSLSEYLSVIPVSMMFAAGLFGRLLFMRLSKFSISSLFFSF